MRITALSVVFSCAVSLGSNVLTEKPSLVRLPLPNGKTSVYCVARFHSPKHPQIYEYRHATFDAKTKRCPEKIGEYDAVKEAGVVKTGAMPLGGEHSDFIKIGTVDHEYRNKDFASVLAYPVDGGDPSMSKWEIVCVTESHPKNESKQSPLKDIRTVCPKVLPEGPVDAKDIDQLLEKDEIFCPYPAKCKATEIAQVSQEEYLKKLKEEEGTATNRLLRSGTRQQYSNETSKDESGSPKRPPAEKKP